MQSAFGETLVDVLERQVETNPSNLLYEFINDSAFNSERLTYHQLHTKVLVSASHLISRGLKVGDRALLIYPPGVELIITYFACLYAGIVAVPVYPPVNIKLAKKLQYIIKDATPAIVLTTTKLKEVIDLVFNPLPEYLKKPLALMYSKFHRQLKNPFTYLFDILPKNKNILFTDTFDDLLDFSRPDINHDTLAFLQYTSGSTNKPKGVKISHKNLIHNLGLAAIPWKNSLNGVCWLPPYHDMGLISGILFPMVMNFPIRLFSPIQFLHSPIDWLKLISKYAKTSSIAPNFAYEYCISKITDIQKKDLDLSNWEMAWNGAEPVRMSTMDRFVDAFQECGFKKSTFYPCYGLAESTVLISINTNFDENPCLTVSTKDLHNNLLTFKEEGTSIVNVGTMYQTTHIVNPETCEKLGENEIGEIWVHGDSVSTGYWNNTDETNKVFHGMIIGDTTKTLYLRTGDLGFIHKSNLYITGRIKDLIIIRGKNYYPQDIELVIEHENYLIRKGCSVAFSTEEDTQEYLTVVCETQIKKKHEFEQLAKDICKSVAKEYSFFPHNIIFIPLKTLPKTTSGKVQRQLTKKLFLSNSLKIQYLWESKK